MQYRGKRLALLGIAVVLTASTLDAKWKRPSNFQMRT